MPLTLEDKKYLEYKHRGGESNSKGNAYELYYATYQIALLIKTYLEHLDDAVICSQLENCFVDDLFIATPTKHKIYHQLKNVAKISWETKNLHYDFKKQMEISTENHEEFELKLVHSNPEIEHKINDIPKDIENCTSTPYFPYSESINQLVLGYAPFKTALLNISHSIDANDDELSGIATSILGVWAGMKQKMVTLKQISETILRNSKGHANIITYPNVEISAVCKNIFNELGLAFYTGGTKLYWSAFNGRMQGNIPWTPTLENDIETGHFTNVWEVIEHLN